MSTVAGSIPRTKIQKLSEIRSVRDFGDVGVGLDDLQAIRNAIGSLPQLLGDGYLDARSLEWTSTVTTALTTVTWVSGHKFDESLKRQTIQINGVNKVVANVIDSTHLSLTTSVGTNASPVPVVYYANCGEIVLPEPPAAAYNISDTLEVSSWVTFKGSFNSQVTLRLLANSFNTSEKFMLKVLTSGVVGSADPAFNFTHNVRLENLVLDCNAANGNSFSAGLNFNMAQVSHLKNIQVTGAGKRGFYGQAAYCKFDNVWANNIVDGPGFHLKDSHDVKFTWIGTEFVNVSGAALDAQGHPNAGLLLDHCQDIEIGVFINESDALPMKIAGCQNVGVKKAFFNGNFTFPPYGCRITDGYTGDASVGIDFERYSAFKCAVAIKDTSTLAGVSARNIERPGAPSWIGTVTVAGTTVTRLTGPVWDATFKSFLVTYGAFVEINGGFYQVLSVTNTSTLVIATSLALVGVAFAYEPFSFGGQYSQEQYIQRLISSTNHILWDDEGDALNFHENPLRMRGISAGVNELQGPSIANEPVAIVSITNPALGAVTLEVTAHGRTTGDRVELTQVTGQARLEAPWKITVVDANHYTLDGAVGSGVASGGFVALAHGYRRRSQFDANYDVAGFPGAPRPHYIFLGDQLALQLTPGEVSGGVARWTTDHEFLQALSFGIPIKGSGGGTNWLRVVSTILQLATAFDDISIQAGTNANPHTVTLRAGDTVATLELLTGEIVLTYGSTTLHVAANGVGVNMNAASGFAVDVTGQMRGSQSIRLLGLTASSPIITDSQKTAVSGKIDVGLTAHIAATGISDQHVPKWDSGTGKFIDGGAPLTGTVAIASGGTGSTTDSGARTNLDVYSKSEVDTAIAAEAADRASADGTLNANKVNHGTYPVIGGFVTI